MTPLLLLPPSKGKAPGGDGPPYGDTLRHAHPLASARRSVLDRLTAGCRTWSDAEVARLTGTSAADADAQRTALASLPSAPTMPAHRRYTGVLHGNAGLGALDPVTLGADVRIVSGLLGLVGLDEPVPAYRVQFAATLPGHGSLATYWRDHLGEQLHAAGRGRRVWDLLPAEHARVWSGSARRDLEVIGFRFERPDGRAANAARTKVCKGRLVANILATPGIDAEQLVATADPGEGWTLAMDADHVVATFADQWISS